MALWARGARPSPRLYNQLFRRYPPGHHTELEHVSQVVSEGIVKAAAIESGGVLLASGSGYATIVLGLDLTARQGDAVASPALARVMG